MELGSGVETGGVSGSCGVFGIFPGGKSGGANGGAEELEVVFGPRGRSSGSAGILPTGPGNCSNPSAGSNSAKSGGNSGVLNSSLVGSEIETGFTAMADSRFPQRTRTKFSPSNLVRP